MGKIKPYLCYQCIFLHFLSCLNEIGRHRQKNTKVVVSCELTILCPNCRHGVLLDDVNNLKNGVRLNYALSSIKETLTNFKSVPKVSNLACIPPGGWYIFLCMSGTMILSYTMIQISCLKKIGIFRLSWDNRIYTYQEHKGRVLDTPQGLLKCSKVRLR